MDKETERTQRLTTIDLLHDDAVRDSYATFKHIMAQTMIFPRKFKLRIYAIQRAIEALNGQGLFLEFGVFKGAGLKLFARELEPHGLSITGFDSLQGLSEDWVGHAFGRKKGAYSVQGRPPDLPLNADLRAGWVQDTLPPFLAEHPEMPLAFANVDFDTYSPTAFALDAVKPRLRPGSVLLFDELYGYTGWRNHEYKALIECLPEDSYTFIGFGVEAVAIQMTRQP